MSTAPNSPGAPQATARRGIDPRWYSSTLLTLVLVLGQWRFRVLGDDWTPWAVALGSAVVTELVLGRWLFGKYPNLLSAYISGNSVAILLKPLGPLLWPFALASVLAILSKYVLCLRGRHLWNPTNFALVAMLALASERVSILSHQWTNELWVVAVLWTIGALTVFRARVWHITLAWFLGFVAFAFLRAAVLPDGRVWTELAPLTGPLYTLYMFFMITDPRVQVATRRGQVLVALGVAAAECAIRLAAERDLLGAASPLAIAPPLVALFAVGPAALAATLLRAPTRAGSPAAAHPGG